MSRHSRSLWTLALLVAGIAPLGCLEAVPVMPTASPSAPTGLEGLLLPDRRGGRGDTGQTQAGPRLSANTQAVSLNLGESRALAQNFQTDGGLAPTTGVVWTSNDDAIVSVNPTSGVARAIAKGSAIITAALQADPSVKAQLTVNVADENGVSVIRLTPPQGLLLVGESLPLQAEVVLGTGEVKSNVVWSSSDEKIAKVSAQGKVTAIALGTVQILAAYADDPIYKGQASIRVVAKKDSPLAGASTAPTGTGASTDPGDDPGTVAVVNQGTWVDQPSGVTSTLEYVKFFDDQNGIVAGAGAMLSTSDGGAHWTRSPASATLTAIQKVDFQGSGDGWVMTSDAIQATAGGFGFTPVTDFKATYGATLADFVRTSPTDAYALTSTGLVYKTSDKGVSWSAVTTPLTPAAAASPAAYRADRTLQLYNMQNNTYFGQLAVGGEGIHFFRNNEYSCKNFQTNSYYTCFDRKFYSRIGGNWVTSDASSRIDRVTFTNAKEGWRTAQGGVERTLDGGKTWIPVNIDANINGAGFGNYSNIYTTDASHIWIGAGTGFVTSANGGRTWTGTVLDSMRLKAISVVDETHMWVVGDEGKIKRYVVL